MTKDEQIKGMANPNRGSVGVQEAQPAPVQEPTQWRDMVVVTLVREGINKHRARELADHFATLPKRQWVGLTDEDWEHIDNKKGTSLDTFVQGATWAEVQLRERNT